MNGFIHYLSHFKVASICVTLLVEQVCHPTSWASVQSQILQPIFEWLLGPRHNSSLFQYFFIDLEHKKIMMQAVKATIWWSHVFHHHLHAFTLLHLFHHYMSFNHYLAKYYAHFSRWRPLYSSSCTVLVHRNVSVNSLTLTSIFGILQEISYSGDYGTKQMPEIRVC